MPPRPETAFRRPIPPAPIEAYDLPHPAVPEALDGLTVLHITDTHVRRHERNHRSFRRVLRALREAPVDVVALTGDYMTHPGDEPAAMAMLRELSETWTARLGAFGVFGNHDSPLLMERARGMAGITWMENRAVDVAGAPLRVIGASYPEDLLGVAMDGGMNLAGGGEGSESSPCRGESSPGKAMPLVLAHYPSEVFPAAELGLPIVLAGHTHGGQFRLSTRHVFHTASDMPGHVATGILRLRNTLVCVSRGLGEGFLDFRFNCPQQMPMYTLRRGAAPGGGGGYRTLRAVVRW